MLRQNIVSPRAGNRMTAKHTSRNEYRAFFRRVIMCRVNGNRDACKIRFCRFEALTVAFEPGFQAWHTGDSRALQAPAQLHSCPRVSLW